MHLRDVTKIEEIVVVTDAAGDDDINIFELGYEFEPQKSMEAVLARALKSLYNESVDVIVKDFTKNGK